MKKTMAIMLMITAAGFCGCGKGSFSENEYRVLMQGYLSGEFEAGFDEKLSTDQKEKILKETAQTYKADYASFIDYMKNKHPDTYSRIF